MIIKDNTDSYKQILKSTSVLGGVQVFNILVGILKSKVIAILLGPMGMGLITLYTTTISLISGLTNFGLGTAAVKNIAAANAKDSANLSKTIAVLKRLVLFTGTAGFLLTLVFASSLSKLAFGNNDHANSFRLLAITLWLTQEALSNNAILQGMRQIRYLAKASVVSSSLGMIGSILLYFSLREKGIVPAIILSAVILFLISRSFTSKIKKDRVKVSNNLLRIEGIEMLRMGFLISLSGMLTLGISYLLRVYISSMGGVVEVGLYSAGFTICATYAGMVFTAMGADYYPRLSSVANNNKHCEQEINQQALVAILLLTPILTVLIVFVKFGIIILYSKEFLGIVEMIRWATIGILFQALSWSMGYIFLAKGNSKLYFWNELLAAGYLLGLNIGGYYFYGLKGLGISYFVSYLIHFIQMAIACRKFYKIRLYKSTILIFLIQLLLVLVVFSFGMISNGAIFYIIGGGCILVSFWFSWRELDRKMNLKSMILNKFQKLQ